MQQDSDVKLHSIWQETWELAELAAEEPHPDDTPERIKARTIASNFSEALGDAGEAGTPEQMSFIVDYLLPMTNEAVKALTRAAEHQAAESHLQAEASADRAAADLKHAENTASLIAAMRDAMKAAKESQAIALKEREKAERIRAKAAQDLVEVFETHKPLLEALTDNVIKPFVQAVAGSLGAQAGPILRDQLQHQRDREIRAEILKREQAKAQKEHAERLATDPDYREAQHDIWLYQTVSGNNPEATRFDRYRARMEVDQRERAKRERQRDEERRQEEVAEEEERAKERKEQARRDHDESMLWTIDDATTRIQRTVEDTLEDTVENTVHRTLRDKLFQGPQGPQGPKGPPGRRAIIDVGPTPQASHNLTEEIEE